MSDDIVFDISKAFFDRTILSEDACLELARTAVRIVLQRIPIDNDWHGNRYNTDNDYVLHLWRNMTGHGGQSFDIRVPKRDE